MASESDWPDCPVKNCTNKICLALDSEFCFPHTKGNQHVKRWKIEARNAHRGDGIPTQFINRDGPEAAARIEALSAEVADARRLALEEAATYLDTKVAHHEGERAKWRGGSNGEMRHRVYAEQYRKDAAAIRNLIGEKS